MNPSTLTDESTGMDSVQLPSGIGRNGLEHMLRQFDLDHCAAGFVEVPVALLIIGIAKRAEDRQEWFPRGKWATIQAIQAACDRQLDGLFKTRAPTAKESE